MSYLNKFYLKQRFFPNFISILINPFVLTRWFLVKTISKYAPLLTDSVLDFGCGSKPYKSLFKNASKYTGVDYVNDGHSHDNEDIDFFYDGENLPFENNQFDHVFCSEVLEHVFNYEKVLPEINRVLKPNGYFLITVPFSWNEHELPYDNCRFTVYGIKSLIEKYGFEPINIEKTGHFTMVIAQYVMSYIRELIYVKNKYVNLFLNLLFIAPFTVVLGTISLISPRNKSLYFNCVVLAKKSVNP